MVVGELADWLPCQSAGIGALVDDVRPKYNAGSDYYL